MKSDIQVFAENLRRIRKSQKLTQPELAKKVGLTKQSIMNYEKGSMFPTGNRLNLLLEALEVTPEELLGENSFKLKTENSLLTTHEKQADFFATYRYYSEIVKEDEVIYNFLIQELHSMNISDLFFAVSSVYDRKIKVASNDYTEKLIEMITAPPQSFDSDIHIKK